MHWSTPFVLAALLLSTQQGLLSQASAPRTLAVVAATRDWNGAIPSHSRVSHAAVNDLFR